MIAERSRLVCLPRCRPYPSVPVITDAFWSSHMDAGCMYASLSSSSSTHCPRRHVSAETLSHALSCTQTILSSQLTNCSLLNQFYIDKSVSDDLISIATLRLCFLLTKLYRFVPNNYKEIILHCMLQSICDAMVFHNENPSDLGHVVA